MQFLFAKQFPVTLLACFFFHSLLFAGSSSSAGARQSPKDTTGIDKIGLPNPPSGYLDTLEVSMAEFEKLDKRKLVLSFVFEKNGNLTMHGWSFHGILHKDFENEPNIKLINGNSGNLTYGPGTYYGNLVLVNVHSIKKKLTDANVETVLFIPVLCGNHLRYQIGGRKAFNSLLSVKEVVTIDYLANPSPPMRD